VRLDDIANTKGGLRISTNDSAVSILAMPIVEEFVIARQSRTFVEFPVTADICRSPYPVLP
jgi:acetate kinase